MLSISLLAGPRVSSELSRAIRVRIAPQNNAMSCNLWGSLCPRYCLAGPAHLQPHQGLIPPQQTEELRLTLPGHKGKEQRLNLHFPLASICLVSALITIKDKCHQEDEASQGEREQASQRGRGRQRKKERERAHT